MDAETSIPWKKRTDLVVTYSHERDSSVYVVKDPLSLQYFSLSEHEYFILKSLDGKHSSQTILDSLHRQFPEAEISDQTLKQFLPTLIGANLVVSTVGGYGQMLAARTQRQKNHSLSWLTRLNIIAFRWRGFDPQRLLKRLDDVFGWIYSTPVLIGALILILTACISFLLRVSIQGLPELNLQAIFTAQNVPLLILGIVLIKILHEIGHGLTCVHYGGECHEIGLLFIAFCPLLYCDTTDSWQHPSRWNRATVAAAGIFVELIIASLCCLLWIISVPGVLNLMLFNIMLICSFNTLLVNGNPLLRYDGYYVLSDVINYPNLGSEARRTAQAWFDKLVYGSPLSGESPFSLQRIPLALFGGVSAIYRVFVMVMILWAVHQLLKGYGLGSLSMVIAFPMFAGFVWSLVAGSIRRGKVLLNSNCRTRQLRAAIGFAFFLTFIGLILTYPFPHHVVAPFTVEPGQCKPVFVTVPGKVVSVAPPYAKLEANDVIAELENPAIALANSQTESEVALRELHLQNMKRFRSLSAFANSSLPAAEKSLSIAKDRALAEQQRLERLTITSPAKGILFPPRNVDSPKSANQGIVSWSGTILDSENKSAWVSEQTLIGWVGRQEDFQAVAYVPQHQMEFIRRNTSARLIFMSASSEECVGTVAEIGTETVEVAPREVFHNRLIAADPSLGQFHPSETLYRVRMTFQTGMPGPLYSTGLAKIECPPTSLLSRFWRMLSHAFALDF